MKQPEGPTMTGTTRYIGCDIDTVPLDIRAAAEGAQSVELVGAYAHPETWTLRHYVITDVRGYEWEAACTNGGSIWREQDEYAWQDLFWTYGNLVEKWKENLI